MLIRGQPERQQAAPEPTTVDKVHAALKLASDIVTSIVIIGSFASIIMGTIVIRVYLSNFAVGLSPYESISAVTLHLFMVVFIGIVATAIIFIMAPLGASFIVSPETRQCLPRLFGRRLILTRRARRRTTVVQPKMPVLLHSKSTFAEFTKEYAIFYSPTLLMCWVVPIETYFDVPLDAQTALLPWFFPTTFLLGAALLCWTRLPRQVGSVDTLVSFLFLNFLTTIWLLTALLALGKLIEYEVGPTATQAWAVAAITSIVMVSIAIHMSLSWLRFNARVLLAAAWFIGCALYCYPGYAEIGASALREAQLGGGLMITYAVTSVPSVSPQQPATGCLILATSTYIFVGEPENGRCPRLARFAFAPDPERIRPVKVLARTSVSLAGAQAVP